MAQLVEAVEGIAEACEHFEAPITGGNVSLYNETLGEGIYPTPVLGVIGLLKTAEPIPATFSREGASIALLGGFAIAGGLVVIAGDLIRLRASRHSLTPSRRCPTSPVVTFI